VLPIRVSAGLEPVPELPELRLELGLSKIPESLESAESERGEAAPSKPPRAKRDLLLLVSPSPAVDNPTLLVRL